MRKKLLIILPLLFCFQLIYAQTSLAGKVTEAETGKPILFGNVALFKNGNLVTGVETDFDGNYKIANIDPGTYAVESAYIGFMTQRIEGVLIVADQENRLDIELEVGGVNLEEIIVVDYKVPLIQQDHFSQTTITSDQISQMRGSRSSNGSSSPRTKRKKKRKSKNINALAANAAGISQRNNEFPTAVRGSRSNTTNYYIDGIGVQGSLIPNKTESTDFNTENYATIEENRFQAALETPLSTFSIDVDAASYSNVRRFINDGQLPPFGAVRIEEMLNYFNYNYPQPENEYPFQIITEIADCPWQTNHQLLHIGLQGKKFSQMELPASNLVFLIDVSGSMSNVDKLPLLKSSLKLLVEELRPKDRVAIVVYAGSAGMVLPSTSGAQKETISQAIDHLEAGGSTAGGAGIQLAYEIAKEHFIEEGNNRVILATDGDFNVGVSSDEELVRMIEKKRESGIFLTVLGFGKGNYQDHKMQQLANKGNGQHAYIDNIKEARKVLVEEFGGTLLTIAKDVKLQLEFNPANVQAYRLIGYENRMLQKEDFNDDQKDAGELGAGHTVTALYEIIPVGVKSNWLATVDDLKYQKQDKLTASAKRTDELLTVKLRYKQPDGEQSQLLEKPILDQGKILENTSDNFRFSAAVAGFGLLLRDSKFKQNTTYAQVKQLAKKALGKDERGYRKEFIELIKIAESLNKKIVAETED